MVETGASCSVGATLGVHFPAKHPEHEHRSDPDIVRDRMMSEAGKIPKVVRVIPSQVQGTLDFYTKSRAALSFKHDLGGCIRFCWNM